MTLKKLTLLFTLLAAAAAADTLNLTNPPGFTYAGYYVGRTTGNLDGGEPFRLVCNDFEDRTPVPSSFDVTVSAIPTLQYALYAGSPPTPEQVLLYEQASILIWQMLQPANHTPAGIGGIQFAVWNLFYPGAPDPGSSPAWVSWVRSQNASSWDYSGVRVYTPAMLTPPHNQEFMSGSAVPVPEPNFLPLGLLLMGACRLIRRR